MGWLVVASIIAIVFVARAWLKEHNKEGARDDILYLEGDGTFEFDIVGESFYQDHLAKIAGPKSEDGVNVKRIATLVPEPGNPHDSNAVGVFIDDMKVGHLSRDNALSWHEALRRRGRSGQSVEVDALISGGWVRKRGGEVNEGHYGVKLDI